MKFTASLRALVNKNHPKYKARMETLKVLHECTPIMFDKFTTHINLMEQSRTKQNVNVEDVDSFLLEQRYLTNIAAVMKDVSDLRSTFLQLW